MPHYSIYKLVSDSTEDCYVGSTKLDLKTRLSCHKSAYNRYKDGNNHYISAYDILANDDVEIVLIETVDEVKNVFMRERYHIDVNQSVNRNKPARTPKQYYVDNKERISLQKKVYYVKNREKIKERAKRYYHHNKWLKK